MMLIIMIMMMMMMIMIMMMMINMMMKIKMVITWPIIELGDPNFALQQIQIIPTDDNNEDDAFKLGANFQARSQGTPRPFF